MSNRTIAVTLAGAVAALVVYQASVLAQSPRQLTIVSWGGNVQEAQRKAFFEPFANENNVRVVEEEWQGELAKLRAMVQSGNITWDVVSPSVLALEAACQEGLLERVDPKLVDPATLVDQGVTQCGIATNAWAQIFAYDPTKFPKGGPESFADFWDVKKFPGPRAMRRSPRGNMEIALLADGVAPADLYKVLRTKEGVDRAFRKLDQIKPDVKVWFASVAQSPQLLVDGEVVMATGFGGRFAAAALSGKKLTPVWNGQGTGLDYFAVVKGSRNKDLAMKFLAFQATEGPQLAQVKIAPNGPVNRAAAAKLPPDLALLVPTNPKNMRNMFMWDNQFWADYGDELNTRFTAWLSK